MDKAMGFFDKSGAFLGKALRDTLFPPHCFGCEKLVAEPGSVCGGCWPKIRFIERPFCEVLGTPFQHDLGEGMLSGDAIANPPPFRRARAAVGFSGVPRQMVQSLKYHDHPELARWMAAWMVRAGRESLKETDVIVPVPLHPRRFLMRRFNQSAELARHVGRQTGKPFDPAALFRVKLTKQQVGLGALERQDNVRGAFKVPDEARIKIAGKGVLLIDDVYTTGATVIAATNALTRGGAAHVDVLTFARVIPGDYSAAELEML
jgi:ComF family protein